MGEKISDFQTINIVQRIDIDKHCTRVCYVLNVKPEEQKVLNIISIGFYCRCFIKSQCKCHGSAIK